MEKRTVAGIGLRPPASDHRVFPRNGDLDRRAALAGHVGRGSIVLFFQVGHINASNNES